MSNRIRSIDYLKTFAILSVVFYHIGVLSNGYLGVDVFFVIGGYLFIRSNKKNFECDTFNPIKFLLKKAAEFWPLVAIGGLISLAIGYQLMLPDAFENLSESVVASNFFANNILQVITTRDYWDISNTFKPLMHTWYIGVLLQCFVFMALFFWTGRKLAKKDITKYLLGVLTLFSFVLYLLPISYKADRFYYPYYRLFEIAVGGMLVYAPEIKINKKKIRLAGILSAFVIALLILSGIELPARVVLISTVVATCIIIYSSIYACEENPALSEKTYSIISIPGRYSYDIYIWHQIVIAFLYYSVFQSVSIYFIIAVVLITAALSAISIIARKKLSFSVAKKIICSSILVVITTVMSLYFYTNAGVVRNVPELGIVTSDAHKSMHSEYVDRPYSWNNDFEDDSKIHILVIGNSFGKDFANVLSESALSDKIEISYSYNKDALNELDRIEEADYVFFGSDTWGVPSWVTENVDADKLYIVGNKRFGASNGIIYGNRNKEWYFDQTAKISDDFILNNNAENYLFGSHYIDMITPLLNDNNEIRLFTDDGYYISQDCRHLTKYGAQYYSRILDLSFISE